MEGDFVETAGIAGAYILVEASDDSLVPVRMVNTTPQEIHLLFNKPIGVLIPAVTTESLPETTVCRHIATANLGSQFSLLHIAEPEKSQLQDLISECRHTFSTGATDIGHSEVIVHRLPTRDTAPVYRKAYRILFSKRVEMDQQVNKLFDKRIIEHSTSPWERVHC